MRIERQRVRAEERRHVREAAIRADVRVGAGDDPRLHVEIVRRRHQVIDRMDASAVALRDVLVVVKAMRRVQQHDVDMPRELVEIRRDERLILRRVGQRRVAVELRGDVPLRQPAAQIAGFNRRQRAKRRERFDQRDRHPLEPEVIEQPVHRRRMQQAYAAQPALLRHLGDDLAVEAADVDVLQAPALLENARVIAGAELFRRIEREHVLVIRRQVAIPRCRAATRDDDELRGIEVAVRLRPPQERNPVQQLEARFGQPRSNQNGTSASAERRDELARLLRFRQIPPGELFRGIARTSRLRRQR